MEKKIIKSLNKELKEIKVTGQGCLNDCKVWHEVSGQHYYHASLPCYTRRCTGYYKHTSFWTKRF